MGSTYKSLHRPDRAFQVRWAPTVGPLGLVRQLDSLAVRSPELIKPQFAVAVGIVGNASALSSSVMSTAIPGNPPLMPSRQAASSVARPGARFGRVER
jgi:hypothetical protein